MEVNEHATHTLFRPAPRRARVDRPAAGLGAPPSRARDGDVPRRPRPQRARAGRGQERARCHRRRRPSTWSALATANAQAPGGIEVTEPVITPADRARRHAARRALAARPQRRPAHPARQRAGHLAASRPSGRDGSSLRRPCAVSGPDARRGRASRRSRPPSSSSRRPSRARTSSRSTTSAGRRTSPRARSSTSSAGRVSSSGSTRSGRSSARSRTTRCGTWRSTSRSTSSSVSSRTTATSSPCLRDVLAGMVGAVHDTPRRCAAERTGARGARRARGVPGPPLPRRPCPGRGTRRRAGPRARARAGAGAWAMASHRSDFVAVEGYPMVKRPFYTHPWAPAQPHGRVASDSERIETEMVQLLRPDLPGVELVSGGQRLHRPSSTSPHPRPRRGYPRALRVVRPRVPARHAAARRVRDRPRAVDEPADRRRQRPGGDPFPPRPEPAHPVT